ncbi:MAG: hypothetical protein RLZZ313_394, partial [Verrucomicrobiota bacterium]
REIHAGGGYGSQDSSALVLASSEASSVLKVLWPGGVSTESPVPQNAREVRVRREGVSAVLTVVR